MKHRAAAVFIPMVVALVCAGVASLQGASSVSDPSSWMGGIPDERRLSEITIPGTHDTMALHDAPLPDIARTQSMDLGKQLRAGVRFLDIRCRHLDDGFEIYHGPIDQHSDFTAVLNTVHEFLRAHPSETVIMSVKEEYTPKHNTRSFVQTFMSHVALHPGMWELGEGIPSLGVQGTPGSVRGKIVLLRRFACEVANLGIDATRWPDNHRGGFPSGELCVQDHYRFKIDPTHPFRSGYTDEKWSGIHEQLLASAADRKHLHLNFCSASLTFLGIPWGISRVADKMNARVSAFLKSNPKRDYGIIILDHANPSLIREIYGSNQCFP